MSLLARRLTVSQPVDGNGNGNGGVETSLLVDDGVWTWFHDPRGVHFSSINNRTYLSWGDKSGGVWVGSLDHGSDEFHRTKMIQLATVNDHHIGSLGMRSDGRIIACYARHNNEMRRRISIDPEDITSWGPEVVVHSNAAYPNLFYLSAETRWYLFFRNGIMGPTQYRTSDNNGESWSSAVTLWNPGANRPYFKIVSNGTDEIHFAVTDGHPDDTTTSIYHFYYDGAWRDSSGTNMGSPSFGTADATKVHDGVTNSKAWPWGIALDAGSPVIVFATFPSSTDHRYQYAKLGASWDVNQITAAGKHIYAGSGQPSYSAGLYLDPDAPDDVYLCREVATDQWELEKWTTSDGGSSWSSEAVTSGSTGKNIRPFVPAGSPIDVVWLQGTYTSFTDFDMSIQMSPDATVDPQGIPTPPSNPVTTGILHWVDVSVYASLLDSGGASGNIDDRDLVTTWEDQSANGYDLAGAADGSRPVYFETGIGQRASLEFAGSLSRSVSGGVPVSAGSDWTEFIVVMPSGWGGTNPGIWRSGSSSTGNTFFIFQGSTGRPWVRWNGTEILQPGSGYQLPLNEPSVMTLQVESGSSVAFRVNGTTQHSNSHAVATPSFSIFNFFWQNDAAQKVRGYYSERVAYDRLLTPTEVEDVEDYLMEKWHIS